MCMNSNNNEKIEVHDASILRSNEHPKFNVGDVINNGYGDFIVKGFNRSFLGLAYVLDNGRKLICWLTEKADAKCYLAERKYSMNNMPDKIYRAPYGDTREDAPITENDIEYIRTDVFIEKAFEFFGEHLWEYIDVEKANCDTFVNIDDDKLKEDFKEYMKW